MTPVYPKSENTSVSYHMLYILEGGLPSARPPLSGELALPLFGGRQNSEYARTETEHTEKERERARAFEMGTKAYPLSSPSGKI